MPIPTSGNFRILVGLVASKNGDYQAGTVGATCGNVLPVMSDAAIAAYLNANGGGLGAVNSRWTDEIFCDPVCFGIFPIAGLHKINFWPATDEFIFNPGGSEEIVDILTAEMPNGFLCTALQLFWRGTARKTSSGVDIIDFKLSYDNTVVHSDATPNLNNSSITTSSTAIIPAGLHRGLVSALGLLSFEATHVEATVVPTSCGDFDTSQSQFQINQFYFQGDYILWSSNIAINPSTVFPDDIVTITADGDLDQITDLVARYRDDDGILSAEIPLTMISQSATQIVFAIPQSAFGGAKILISGTGNGVEFSGQTNLGSLNAGLVDGSGLYTLVPGKRDDTYYDRSVNPPTTVDVAIPTPRAKTGYFNA